MVEFIFEMIKNNAGEIGTAVVLFIVRLLEKGFDKKKLRKKLNKHGVNLDELKDVL